MSDAITILIARSQSPHRGRPSREVPLPNGARARDAGLNPLIGAAPPGSTFLRVFKVLPATSQSPHRGRPSREVDDLCAADASGDKSQSPHRGRPSREPDHRGRAEGRHGRVSIPSSGPPLPGVSRNAVRFVRRRMSQSPHRGRPSREAPPHPSRRLRRGVSIPSSGPPLPGGSRPARDAGARSGRLNPLIGAAPPGSGAAASPTTSRVSSSQSPHRGRPSREITQRSTSTSAACSLNPLIGAAPPGSNLEGVIKRLNRHVSIPSSGPPLPGATEIPNLVQKPVRSQSPHRGRPSRELPRPRDRVRGLGRLNPLIGAAPPGRQDDRDRGVRLRIQVSIPSSGPPLPGVDVMKLGEAHAAWSQSPHRGRPSREVGIFSNVGRGGFPVSIPSSGPPLPGVVCYPSR